MTCQKASRRAVSRSSWVLGVCLRGVLMHSCIPVSQCIPISRVLVCVVAFCIDAFMHSCIYAFMYLCTHVFMYLCIHAFMHLCIHAFMHLWIDAFMHSCIHALVHATNACMYSCIRACMHSCMHALPSRNASQVDVSVCHVSWCLGVCSCVVYRCIHPFPSRNAFSVSRGRYGWDGWGCVGVVARIHVKPLR